MIIDKINKSGGAIQGEVTNAIVLNNKLPKNNFATIKNGDVVQKKLMTQGGDQNDSATTCNTIIMSKNLMIRVYSVTRTVGFTEDFLKFEVYELVNGNATLKHDELQDFYYYAYTKKVDDRRFLLLSTKKVFLYRINENYTITKLSEDNIRNVKDGSVDYFVRLSATKWEYSFRGLTGTITLENDIVKASTPQRGNIYQGLVQYKSLFGLANEKRTNFTIYKIANGTYSPTLYVYKPSFADGVQFYSFAKIYNKIIVICQYYISGSIKFAYCIYIGSELAKDWTKLDQFDNQRFLNYPQQINDTTFVFALKDRDVTNTINLYSYTLKNLELVLLEKIELNNISPYNTSDHLVVQGSGLDNLFILQSGQDQYSSSIRIRYPYSTILMQINDSGKLIPYNGLNPCVTLQDGEPKQQIKIVKPY